ncbi:hypothetical protein [Streptomyces sp. NPDC004546]|uniref:hypothetical protein n=1 Tax=Streptomyces sp. NPDC004546 TaxID=3154282 RepID=UPI0033B9E59F
MRLRPSRADFLVEDRIPAVTAWVERTTAHLPELIRAELAEWSAVMLNGSTTTPRRRPGSVRTIRNHLYATLPALNTWIHTKDSLRAVSRDDVLDVLPNGGTARSEMLQGLRSIFQILHGRRLVFTNPTARTRVGMPEIRTPVSLDVPVLRRLLDDPDPGRVAIAALLVFHGLRPRQVRTLKLTDLVDGRLLIDEQRILLAPRTRAALNAYLAYRGREWPRSGNPHLLINRATAGRLIPVTGGWINTVLGIPAQALREDRILEEAHASEGDPRRIADLFGLTVNAAQRYAATVDHTSFTEHQRRRGQSSPS